MTTPMPTPIYPQNTTSTNTTDVLLTTVTTETGSTEHSFNSTKEEDMGSVNEDKTKQVSVETASTPSPGVIVGATGQSFWGYVVLAFIIVLITILCAILYLLRRVSRTYSFDLHRQIPSNHLNEPIGTFEPVYLDDLDRPAPKDQLATDDLSPPPLSNGTTIQTEERASNGESAPPEHPEANGLETSPPSNTGPSLSEEPVATSSPMESTNMFFDAIGEQQQNENNNNPSVCSTDPFVEINLEEPAWCDQLLTSPEAPSSVLPFSPFSFSSSTSSS